MADTRVSTSHFNSETLNSRSSAHIVLDCANDLTRIDLQAQSGDSISVLRNEDCCCEEDSVLCVSGSRLVRTGLKKINLSGNIVKFVNTGGGAIANTGDSSISIMPDTSFEGGDILRTDEGIIDDDNFAPLYQSARFGNFCYRFDNLLAGDYFVDLHFMEIINTNGPKGMRVVSDLDIYSIVGANKPLQLVDIRVTVGEDGVIVIRFKGVNGNPLVSGICIKRFPKILASQVKQHGLVCNNCSAEIEVSAAENKHIRMRSTVKYEKKIEELSTQCQLKTNECYEAWMSLTSANEELQKVRMELDNKSFENHCLDQAKATEAAKLRDLSSRCEHERRFWAATIDELKRNIKTMKAEHSQLSREAHQCADSIPDLDEMVKAVRGLVAQCDDLKLKYSEEQMRRKQLYNQIQEAKGNIRVFCRCRPLSKEEASAGYATVVDFNANKDGELGILTGGSTKRLYKFDRVYSPKDDQVDVFADASPMVTSVLDGYNVCIFAYGQTGTGKTFTMEGIEQNRGVNYRTLEQLFKIAEERKEIFIYKISVSVLEVYNEQIRDLLATSPTPKKLEIRKASEGVHHVPGIVEAKVDNIKEAWDVLQAGSNARAVGSNNVNEHSSRSHCMLCIMVGAKNLINGECTQSKLWLVDLAGSERLAKTEAQGDRLKEAQNINRSLSALGDVISALASKSSHIPYRNSKLTHLLQDSLGGDSKTLMFVQISPSEQDFGETQSSLNFATRVRGVELGPAKRQIDVCELQKLKLQLDKAKQESRSKDDLVQKLQENCQNLEDKFKGKDQICKNQQEKLKDIESQLELKTALHKQMEKQSLQFSQGCSSLQQKVNELQDKLRESEHMGSKSLQHQIEELENKLEKKTQDFELQTAVLQEKVMELEENKLKLQRSNAESQSLHEKIKELQEKLRQQDEVSENVPPLFYSEKSKTTPSERKTLSTTESTLQRDYYSLSVKSSNRSMSHGSVLLKGTNSLRELRRKGDLQSGGIENSLLFLAPSIEKNLVPIESNKGRQIDPSKAFARVTRTTKPFPTAQRFSSSKQVSGAKEKDTNTRVWLR
ncbi:di-glucose binding protein with Kinesin motor domain-containing protein [Actinidia rufa]|uniref:Di-glucose binding protein with Kinesin motor domain-containing protein n=1 Tax=Actinidia rufa TaxID=165716 RepID=A0A7J0FBK0_9ERIC|nr:di-glucose binding protein with Kinesin motor domain-containing protein [Actinidia rufa]